MNENTAFEMQPEGAGEDYLFQVLTLPFEVLYAVSMVHADHILFDDRTLIQLLCHIMTRSADDLHSPFIGLLIRRTARKGRQERMMNVDKPVRKTLYIARA